MLRTNKQPSLSLAPIWFPLWAGVSSLSPSPLSVAILRGAQREGHKKQGAFDLHGANEYGIRSRVIVGLFLRSLCWCKHASEMSLWRNMKYDNICYLVNKYDLVNIVTWLYYN
ncbi:unnamed protein product [Pylaiella littoralis]